MSPELPRIDPPSPIGSEPISRRGESSAEITGRTALALRSLVELSNDLNDQADVYQIADVALLNLMGQLRCSRSALWFLPEGGAGDAVLLRATGVPTKLAKALGSVWASWMTSSSSRDPVTIDDLRTVGSAPGLDLAEQAEIVLVAPIVSGQRLAGLIALGRRASDDPLVQRELDALSASLNFIGAALENAAFTNRTVESNRRLRRANERLEELDSLKSEFLRNLNHELRTPLTVISAYVDSLLMAPETPPRREHLESLRRETSKLEAMLMRLLDFGRLQEDCEPVDVAPSEVCVILNQYCEERQPGIAAELRELRLHCSDGVLTARFERSGLLRIVDCLVDNAVKFAPPGSIIDICAHEEAGLVRIDVTDDGPGISPERLPHIWDSFRQGDGSETRRHGGMGIGLALARKLASRMNGSLDVETELGVGTTFTLRLPAG